MNVISNTKPSLRDFWETPSWLVVQVAGILKVDFQLDPCTSGYNEKAPYFFDYSDEQNGLIIDWHSEFKHLLKYDLDVFFNPAIWVNPPFSNLDAWIDKVIEESNKGLTIAFLHPNNSDTKWCRKIEENCFMQLIPNSRINFIDPETGKEKSGVNFHSVISIFNGMPRESVQRIRFDLAKPVKQKAVA